MSAQTSYSRNQAIALAGMIYAVEPHERVSRSVETAAGIGFGVAVSRGTDPDKQCVVGGDGTFFGVTIRSLDREGDDAAGAISYAEKATAAIMRKGSIWAVCPAGCVPGDAVHYNDITGVLDAGAAAAGETDIAGATWETTAAAGELAVLRLA